MKTKALSLLLILTLGFVAWAGNDYKGGSGEAVKSWGPKPFESIKGGFQPLAIYIYDPAPKTNTFAKYTEGKDCLDNADLKAKLAKFAHIKVKSDKTDAIGWPDDWLKAAQHGGILILMPSDNTNPLIFDVHKTPKERDAPTLIKAADAILAYETKKREEAEKAAKLAEPAKEKEKVTEVVKPIAGLEEKPKADPKKTDSKKAPGDMKGGDDKKTADAKDPKKPKKGPDDE